MNDGGLIALSLAAIERDFREAVSARIELVADGAERYRVLNPFLFDDGDHFSIVLRREGERWVLSDEGNTWMRLTYDLSEKDLRRGSRRKVIADALSQFGIEDRDHEFVISVVGERYGDALLPFVQGISRVASVALLSRERVSATFREDRDRTRTAAIAD